MTTLTDAGTSAEIVLADHIEACAANAIFCATDNGVAPALVRETAASYLIDGSATCRCPEKYPGRDLTPAARVELLQHKRHCIDNAECSATENGATYEEALEWAANYLISGTSDCMCNPED